MIKLFIYLNLHYKEYLKDTLGIGDWGLGIGPNPQSPIPNPQSPIPINIYYYIMQIILIIYKLIIKNIKEI